MYPDDFLLPRLLYRDALILIIDKPAGLPVHKGTGGGDNLERYFPALQFGLPNAPALGHRLDRDTSGCLVLGRNRHGLATLGSLFSHNKISKTYWAIVEGAPAQPEGTIDVALAKQSGQKSRWWMKADPAGQPSLTDYKVMGRSGNYSWIEFNPRTGRTHQLRVHAQVLGCPIVGDKIYNKDGDLSKTLQLHARSITVPFYPKKDAITAIAPVPEHMQELLGLCGFTS